MNTRSSLLLGSMWTGLVLLSTGCASTSPQGGDAAAPAPLGSTTTTAATGADEKPASPEAEKEFDKLQPPTIVAAKPGEMTYTVNAMIGQINGRPIFASTVLQPLEGQLRAWGSTLAPREFRMAASKLVGDRLYQIVFDTLFLGEAERHLDENERFGLKVNLRMNRQELVRRYGGGSEPLADEEMRKKTGKGLEETLNTIKQTILIRKYQDSVVMPKIIVSRRDVERYYYDPVNYEKFNPKPGRKIRIIRVTGEARADEVDVQLAAGKRFAELATERSNQYNREGGGLMVTKDEKERTIEFTQGDKVFGIPALNDALIKLKAGETSPRITTGTDRDQLFWWLHLEAIDEGKKLSLREAQLQIEQQIRGNQYLILEQRYRKKLFEDAGYTMELSSTNPLADMGRSLVEIAVNVHGPSAPIPGAAPAPAPAPTPEH